MLKMLDSLIIISCNVFIIINYYYHRRYCCRYYCCCSYGDELLLLHLNKCRFDNNLLLVPAIPRSLSQPYHRTSLTFIIKFELLFSILKHNFFLQSTWIFVKPRCLNKYFVEVLLFKRKEKGKYKML